MAAVTQQVPTFLGGVSRQQDTKKTPGQMTEILNGFPDPAFGLIKRNGNQFLTEFTPPVGDDLENAYWFSINRDDDESYVVAITNAGRIKWWNLVPTLTGSTFTWAEGTVVDAATQTYLTTGVDPVNGPYMKDVLETVTYLDQTYLINKQKEVAMLPKSTYNLKRSGTVILAAIEVGNYDVYLDGTLFRHIETTGNATALHILQQLQYQIDPTKAPTPGPSIGYVAEIYGSSLEITKTTAFDLEVKGGDSGKALTSYQDGVTNTSRLSATSPDGRRVKILNSIDDRNSYFVKFIGVAGSTSETGTGYWQEDLGWDEDPLIPNTAELASEGFDITSMPYKLVNNAKNSFTVGPEAWAPRATGNDLSCPIPSFVGNVLKYGVLNSNRLALLGPDSIVLSASKDIANFFYTSAQTVTAADPIDIDIPSARAGTLHSAISRTQGLILFTQFEQFLLFSESGNLTPFDSIIRTIGQYENAADIEIQDVGPYVTFISRTPLSSKIFGMQPRGGNETPNTSEISQIVTGYIPSDVTKLIADPQNSLIAAYSPGDESIFMYKFYSNGQEQLMQAWFKWKVVGSVKYIEVLQNIVVLVTESAGVYNLSIISLIQDPYPLAQKFPSGTSDLTTIAVSNARLDFLYLPVGHGTITYDPVTNRSTLPRPYNHITGKRAFAVKIPTVTPQQPTRLSDLPKLFITSSFNPVGSGVIYDIDETDWTTLGDLTGLESQLVIGYSFDYEVELPTYYFNQGQSIDWSANLTVARMKFNVGLSGYLEFYLKRYGATEWNLLQPVIQADYYLSDVIPLNKDTVFTVPIHQRNTNYQLKLKSTSPFPVTLTSMTWEGNYSTRYYRRA